MAVADSAGGTSADFLSLFPQLCQTLCPLSCPCDFWWRRVSCFTGDNLMCTKTPILGICWPGCACCWSSVIPVRSGPIFLLYHLLWACASLESSPLPSVPKGRKCSKECPEMRIQPLIWKWTLRISTNRFHWPFPKCIWKRAVPTWLWRILSDALTGTVGACVWDQGFPLFVCGCGALCCSCASKHVHFPRKFKIENFC